MDENTFWTRVWLSSGIGVTLIILAISFGAHLSTAKFVAGGYVEKFECSDMAKVWVRP